MARRAGDMNVKLEPDFLKKLKNVDVRIRKSFKQKIDIFAKNPNDPQLNNHLLRKSYEGLRSIDITADYRAVYQETEAGEEKLAYFIILGTHQELYQ